MVRPQWCLNNTWRHTRNADSEELVQFRHGAHETADTVFGGRVNRGGEGCILPGDTGDVDNVPGLLGVAVAQEVGNGELSDADWVCEVDIDQPVPATSGRVLTGLGSRRPPEIGPVLLLVVSCAAVSIDETPACHTGS